MTPKIILLSRHDIETQLEALKRFTDIVPIEMAIAVAPEDAAAAQKITPVVACFQKPTAIVADFPASLVINEDGSIEPLALPAEEFPEAPLIQLAE